MKQFPSERLLARVHSNREAYAQSYIEAAQVYESHDVYKMMSMFVKLVHATLQSRHDISEDRPIVHIDIGSGTGHLLGSLAAHYAGLNRKFCLIGIEINELLAEHSAARLLAQGNSVQTHIFSKEKIEEVRGNLTYRRSIQLNEKALNEMSLDADNSIVIVQEDARKDLRILMAVIDKLKKQGVEHVDSISISLPGTGTDLVLQDSNQLHLSDKKLVTTGVGMVMKDVMSRTCKLAYQVLGVGGAFIPIQRLRGPQVKMIYEEVMSKQFPSDPNEQLMAKSLVAQTMLAGNAGQFRLRSAATLLSDFQEVEAKTPMQFSTTSASGGSRVSEKLTDVELFALGLVRSDLHAEGTRAMHASVNVPHAGDA